MQVRVCFLINKMFARAKTCRIDRRHLVIQKKHCIFAPNSGNMSKKILLYIVFVLLGVLPVVAKQVPAKPFTVVIDAGHGGKDPGAVGKIAVEKDLNLSVALLTGKMIQEQFPDVKVVYTRQTDVFLPLQKRADIVNSNNADLFICIHTNSSESKTAEGVETFILGTEKMDKNLDVAMRENSVIKLEADYQTAYQGFDPNSIDSYIMFELMQNAYMDQSLQFATYVQRQFVENLHRAERGVRQAAFWVLLKSACPSILLEMGFISNPAEEKYLVSEQGQRDMAQSLCNAFAQFTRRTWSVSNAPVDTVSVDNQPVVSQNTLKTTPLESVQSVQTEKKTVYAIQVLASRTPVPDKDARFHGLKCQCLEVNGLYKYYYGESPDREEVVRTQKEIRKHFPDCWIIKLEK